MIMKSTTMGNENQKWEKGSHPQRRRKCLEIPLKRYFRDHLGKRGWFPNLGRNLLSVINVMDGVMVGGNAQLWKTLIGGN